MKLRASEDVTKDLLRIHKYLHTHLDDENDKFIIIRDGAKSIKRETNWGLELLYRVSKDGETGIKEGETYMQISINPAKFHQWWTDIGTITDAFQASIFGLLLTYYTPHNDKPGILAISMDTFAFTIEDKLYSTVGNTPCLALVNDYRIHRPAPTTDKTKAVTFVNKFVISKLVASRTGEILRLK